MQDIWRFVCPRLSRCEPAPIGLKARRGSSRPHSPQATKAADFDWRADAKKQIGLLAVLLSLIPFLVRQDFIEPDDAY
jgi:hypothetical protein